MHGLRRPEAFRYWLYRIIGNAYKSRFRSPWWRRLVFGADVNMETSPAENPSGLYAARRRLDRAFSALTPDDRILVTLCELEGWKIAEAAELMSQTEGQAKTRLSRARKKMRQKLVALYGTQGANNMGENELYELSTGTKKTD
jgi:RNA polymerase sigma-70 factor (ECF subfamily)